MLVPEDNHVNNYLVLSFPFMKIIAGMLILYCHCLFVKKKIFGWLTINFFQMQIPLTDDEVQNLIDELLAVESKVR